MPDGKVSPSTGGSCFVDPGNPFLRPPPTTCKVVWILLEPSPRGIKVDDCLLALLALKVALCKWSFWSYSILHRWSFFDTSSFRSIKWQVLQLQPPSPWQVSRPSCPGPGWASTSSICWRWTFKLSTMSGRVALGVAKSEKSLKPIFEFCFENLMNHLEWFWVSGCGTRVERWTHAVDVEGSCAFILFFIYSS